MGGGGGGGVASGGGGGGGGGSNGIHLRTRMVLFIVSIAIVKTLVLRQLQNSRAANLYSVQDTADEP